MEKIKLLEQIIKDKFPIDPTGHDWPHVHRVKNLALIISSTEGGNTTIIQIAALLHDISDHKFNGGVLNNNGFVAKQLLSDLQFEDEVIEQVVKIVDEISFKGNKHKTKPSCLETKIVQDADRLDAIGAIGIARAFAYGGKHNRPIFDITVLPKNHATFEEYANDKSHTVNHFYEKLLLLKNKMNTQTGRRMAENRHNILVGFLREFYDEWKYTYNNYENELEKWNTSH